MRHVLPILIAACAAFTLVPATAAAADMAKPTTVNVDASQVALQGHDPVAFFGRATLGKAEFTTTYAGATYRFADAANMATFLADPAKYAPQYGGFCAFGASKGKKFPVDISTWQVIDGKLYLCKNPEVKQQMKANQATVLSQADEWWTDYIKG